MNDWVHKVPFATEWRKSNYKITISSEVYKDSLFITTKLPLLEIKPGFSGLVNGFLHCIFFLDPI